MVSWNVQGRTAVRPYASAVTPEPPTMHAMKDQTLPESLNDPATSNPGGPPVQDPGQLLLKWRSHPVRQGGKRLWVVIGALILFPVGLTLLYGPFYGLLALVILGGSMAAYFLPTDYAFYAGGVESRFLGVNRRFTWEQFRSFYRDRNGVLLSPFPQPSRLENFRGVYLRFNGCGEQVMTIVSEHVKPQTTGTPDSGSTIK